MEAITFIAVQNDSSSPLDYKLLVALDIRQLLAPEDQGHGKTSDRA
jgi:hypothetical protein